MYLSQAVSRSAQVNGDGVATIFGDRRQTWAQFHERIRLLGSALSGIGMKKGDRVTVLSQNSDRYIECYYGIPWTGGVIVPLNYRWTVDELVYAIEDAGSNILIASKDYLKEASALLERVPCLQTVVVMDGEDTGPHPPPPYGFHDYEALLADAEPVDFVESRPEDMYCIMYTGGTTGHPKGVMLSSAALWANALFLARDLDYRRGERVLVVAPVFHLAAGATVLAITCTAATHVIVPAFDPEAVLAIVETEKVQHLPLIPSMIRVLLDAPSFGGADLSSVRRVSYGAAPISAALLKEVLAYLPDVGFAQVFGQTEMSPVITTLPPRCHDPAHPLFEKRKSVGQAVISTEIRIIDPDGRHLAANEVGEIVARGPGNMIGYWNKPEQTAETLVYGWVHTGDAGYLDADGYLYLVDRIKDMIVTGAENVYSIEVENALAKHAEVSACAVIGVPDEKWGERVHAVVVPKAPGAVTAEELKEHCRALIAGYKCPKSIEFVDKLPLSAAGKILKVELRKSYQDFKE